MIQLFTNLQYDYYAICMNAGTINSLIFSTENTLSIRALNKYSTCLGAGVILDFNKVSEEIKLKCQIQY